MEHKYHTVSLAFFVVILCAVDFVKASVVTVDKSLAEETYSQLGFRKMITSTTIQDTSSHMRRSIQEKDDHDVCADIIGQGWQMTKQEESPCSTLKVWVPKKTGFTELVKVENNTVEGGFSIAIFCYAIQFLPFNVQPIFIPFGAYDGSYDELVQHIEGQTCEAVAGDVTIRANRTQIVDFTVPYMNSEVYMLVPAVHEWNQTLSTFLKPFSWKLWITIIGSCIFIGVGVAILEYRVNNPKFSAPLYQLPTMVIWFPISTFFFNEGKIVNRNSKVVLVTWLSKIFIVVQIYTATLSSWLTLDQLHPKSSAIEVVGYQSCSFIKDIIEKLNISGKRRQVPLNTAEEYKSVFSNGVDAIVDELPYIKLFLAKYGSDDYLMFGPLNQESGMAFAFPNGSSLLPCFSRAVRMVSESPIMMDMKKKYLGFSTVNYSSPRNQPLPTSLDVKSFIGLFIFMGIVTISAIIASEVSLRRANKKNQSSDSNR